MNEATLKKIDLFAGLATAELAELQAYLKRQSHPAQQTIFWMNEKGDRLYIVEEGKVEISYTDEDGRDVSLAVLEPGAFFGELSLIDGEPHSATARSLEQTALLTLDRDSFYLFLNKHPQLSRTLLQVLTLRLRQSTARINVIPNINEQVEAKSTRLQRSVDNLARLLTSGWFLLFYIFFIVGWMTVQVFLYHRRYAQPVSFLDQPPAFALLEFILTLVSFLLTILILNSQRRQAEADRIRGEVEYQINLKSQTEVVKLQLKMDELLDKINKLETKGTKEKNEPPSSFDGLI
ncbi:cyclic nucleotide-binding domain-containing protein [Flavisolibacter ginsenosidimutans]|uniref:Cyclic nucleotide-binding domain-containing protein n=1 Tax=Flavisolibacter ginsenosidimutans TaxID=661481 RepID=A0A5B8UE53_9BACT|nr:cyclic nucleotide-binding domain-containing protein [Flavisolibacter ginsenosidimutans]QEC54788.1 cyclic nucleotide-binding domain-containing protein [Flavisolibacter ginsenosidimutans]